MVEFRNDYTPSNEELNALNQVAWGFENLDADYSSVLGRSLGHISAFENSELIGFVNVSWDGGKHAFILDTCVAPHLRHRGIGSQMVRLAIELAKNHGAKWLHVDYKPHLEKFYAGCGFNPIKAGLIDLEK